MGLGKIHAHKLCFQRARERTLCDRSRYRSRQLLGFDGKQGSFRNGTDFRKGIEDEGPLGEVLKEPHSGLTPLDISIIKVL